MGTGIDHTRIAVPGERLYTDGAHITRHDTQHPITHTLRIGIDIP